jgi:hypothetical protein
VLLTQSTETAVATATGVAPAGAGNHEVVASYPGDANFVKSVSQPTAIVVGGGTTTSVITWVPTVATIPYGTALGAAQLDATAATAGGVAIPGTFVYTPAAGAVLPVGTQTLSVTFTPTDTVDYTTATASVPITVVATGCPVPGTTSNAMNIAYFTLGESDRDATYFPINSLSSNYVLAALGTNGLPVYNPNATASSGSVAAPHDLLADNEITWWSPQLNNGGAGGASDVVATGTAAVSLPFSNDSFYPPNGAGPNDANGFQTAVLSGTLYAPTAGTVSFSVSSDDAAFVYLDGQIACDDGGDHGATAVPCTTATIAAGAHTLQVFYADLTGPAAALDFSVTSSNVAVSNAQFAFGTMTLSPASTEAPGTSQAVTISEPITYSGPQPTGAVSFVLNGVSYPATCSTAGQPSGQQSCSAVVPAATIAALPVGTYPVTSSFAGDCNYAAVTAQRLTFTIAQPVALAATTTTLAVNSGGSAATTVASGSVVTLTAQVTAGGNSVSPGQVAFCDASAATCTDIHLLATAELVGGDSTSTATYKFVPGIGSHSYKAVFLGTTTYAGSSSSATALAVTGKYATTTALASSGVQGSYALTATVNGFGQGSPSGNVVFKDTSTNGTLGTVAVTGVVRSFVSGSPIPVGSSPNQVVSADVNGDGKLDLVVANQNGPMVTVLIGNGDGTYTASPSFGNNNGGVGIAVGDFNGDGKLDIATANGSSVGIFLGNGDGTFGTEQDFANTGSSKGVSAADVNGDGKLDLVVTDNNSGITIMIGNGDGTFTQLGDALGTGGGPNFQVAVADFNGDGKLDIAFGNKYDNTLSLLLGNGDGTFQPQTVIAAGSAPKGCFAGDFNGDGHQDIILTNGSGATVSVLLGNGDGTFQAEKTYAVGPNPWGAAVSDLNGDGKLDVAVANQDDGTVSVLFGNGDGTFQPQHVIASSGAEAVAIGDTNGDGSPDIVVPNSGSNTAAVFLNQATVALSITGVTLPGTGMDNVVATYSGDTVFTGSTSNTLTLPSNPIGTTVITWTPTVATIAYGTPLGASQLNATAATAAGVAIPGTFVYTPAAGTLLTAGTQTLSVAFTPTSASYTAATATATITVTKAMPVITWANPAGIAYGTALSATQLDATVAGVGTGALAGTLVYTPAAGTVLAPGTQTLSVAFTPADAVDYTGATASVNIVVRGLGLSGISPLGAVLGSTNTTITLTGTGFVTTSVVMAGNDRLATTYVNPTTLTAVIPATLLAATGTLAITVTDPSIESVSAAQTFTVLPAVTAATLTGPATTAPGTQPTVGLTITNPYPLALTAQFTLTFASAGSTPVDDPSIQFSTGGRMYSYTVAANSTTVPPVQLQAGTDAGTITITAKLTAYGTDVTPGGLAPLVIVVPPVVPVISGTTISASGSTLTVVVHGFSNTREVSSAVFDFTAATGDTLATPTLTIPAMTIFSTWYSDATSDAYGSTFTYTQIFNTSGDASTVGSVKVTLTNSVGTSAASTSP